MAVEGYGLPLCKRRSTSHLLLDAQKLVVLRKAFAAGHRADLDLADAGGDRQVGDGAVLRFAATCRDDAAITGLPRLLDNLQRLGQRTDLVYLDKNAVGDALLNPLS